MFDIGRICVKVAGRDAGQKCVIVQKLDKGLVLVDGQTRRRKCNVRHLEPTAETVQLKENASPDDVKAALSKLNIEIRETKPKQSSDRPKKQKAKKEAPAKKTSKKEAKKESSVKAEETQSNKVASAQKQEVSDEPAPKAEKVVEEAKAPEQKTE